MLMISSANNFIENEGIKWIFFSHLHAAFPKYLLTAHRDLFKSFRERDILEIALIHELQSDK